MSDQALWAAVLQQAIDDVIRPDGTAVKKYWMQRHGIAWFNLKNTDFIEVCWLAGLDPEAVFDRFKRMLEDLTLLELPPEEVEKQRRRGEIERIAKAKAAEREKRLAEIQLERDQKAAERAEREAARLQRIEQRQAEHDQKAVDIQSARDLEQQLRHEAREVEKQLRLEAREADRKARQAAKTASTGYHHSAVLYDAFGEQRMLSEWASIVGMPERTIRNRLEAGMALEDALTAPELTGGPGLRSSTLFTIDGTTRMLSEWAALAGITTKTAARRVNEGWPIEKALLGGTYAKRASTARTYTAFGETHTAFQWAKILGMSEGAIAGRLRKGWPIEQALTTPTQQRATRANTTEQEPEIA